MNIFRILFKNPNSKVFNKIFKKNKKVISEKEELLKKFTKPNDKDIIELYLDIKNNLEASKIIAFPDAYWYTHNDFKISIKMGFELEINGEPVKCHNLISNKLLNKIYLLIREKYLIQTKKNNTEILRGPLKKTQDAKTFKLI